MAAHVQPLPIKLSALESQQRRGAIDSALGSTLAEGASPSPAALELGERFISGELTLEEYGTAVRALHGL